MEDIFFVLLLLSLFNDVNVLIAIVLFFIILIKAEKHNISYLKIHELYEELALYNLGSIIIMILSDYSMGCMMRVLLRTRRMKAQIIFVSGRINTEKRACR